MKRFLIYPIAMFLAGIMNTACIEDKGNYNYAELATFYVDTTGLIKSYTVAQFNELAVDPQLFYNGNKENLSFVWRIFPEEWDYAFGQPTDTLSTAEKLAVPITRSSAVYKLEFIAMENNSQRRVWHSWTVNVESSTGTGLMVLYEKNGTIDCDMIKTPAMVASHTGNEVVRNVYSRRNDYVLEGKPVALGMYAYQNVARYITLLTDQDAIRLSPEDFGIMGYSDDIFYFAPHNIKPGGYYGPMGKNLDWNEPYELMINDGQCHVDITAYAAGDPRFASALVGDYYAAPYVLLGHMAYIIIYDQIERRFISAGIFDSDIFGLSSSADSLFDFGNIGKDMLYMDYGYGLCSNSSEQYMAYAFFKDRTGSGRYIYVMDFSEASQSNYSARALISLSACEDITSAELFTVGRLGPVAFYAAGNKVYQILYDLDSDTATSKNAWPKIPANEKITCMKLNDHPGIGLAESVVSKYLFVATYDESTGSGKLYILAVNEVNGTCLEEPVAVFEGFGKIRDVTFKYI